MFFAILACAMSIVIDQLTKYMAFAMQADVVRLTSFLLIEKAKNKGAAFGFLGTIENSNLILIPLSIITIIILIVLVRNKRNLSPSFKVPFGLVLGGALSNLYDRLQFGYVKDFIHLHFKQFSWPVFNFADVFICVGVFILVFAILKHHPHENLPGSDNKPQPEKV